MRLLLTIPDADGPVPVRGEDGGEVCRLWCGIFRNGPLDLRVLAVAPLELPSPEPSEPVAGAIGRVVAAVRGRGAVTVLIRPGEALGAQRIVFADGIRMFGLQNAADEACWDQMLSLGFPVWGARGTLVLDALMPTAESALSALAYGLFHCADGVPLAALEEDRRGVRWQAADPAATATVVIRGGFEAATLGAEGRREDRGNETYVRLVVRGAAGTCWTQPRFVVAARPAMVPVPPAGA